MTEEQKQLSTVETENTLAASEDTAKKPGLMRGARDFIENTFNSLKGKDLTQAVDEFTSEMTIVIEGMSEDMAKLRCDADEALARITIFENDLGEHGKECGDELKKLRKSLEAMEKRLNALEKPDKKSKKANLSTLIKQLTWLAAIICGSWIAVTVLQLIGG